MKNAKIRNGQNQSSNTNNQKCRSYRYKNTYILSPYDLFCEGPETKYGNENQTRVNKERKHI